MEDPGDRQAQHIFLAHGSHILPVPVDVSGLITEHLDSPQFDQTNLLYLTPSHQAPTGSVLSAGRRIQILNWARKTGTLLVENDTGCEFAYDYHPLQAMQGLDPNGPVIYVGNFSDLLSPVTGIGYMVLPENLVSCYRNAVELSGKKAGYLEQTILADLLRSGQFERYLRSTRKLLQSARTRIVHKIQLLFGNLIIIYGHNTGRDILLRFDPSFQFALIEQLAREVGLNLVSIRTGYLTGPSPGGEYLLDYSSLPEDEILESLAGLAKGIQADRIILVPRGNPVAAINSSI